MNDAPSSSHAPPLSDVELEQDGLDDDAMPLTADELSKRRKTDRENFQKRRAGMLDDLLRNLDILVYAELSTIYYMDCHAILFFMRAMSQFMTLTPKSAAFQEPPQRFFLTYIMGSNLLCLLLHCLLATPSAGELTRGYLHGGLVMDFIGQKAPSGKFHLVLLDFMVLGLQLVHLSAATLRRRLRVAIQNGSPVTTAVSVRPTGQTLEDEERGVRRSAEEAREGDIEMQNLTATGELSTTVSSEARPLLSEDEERVRRLATFTPARRTEATIFDAFNSGQMVVADLDVSRTLREHLLLMRTKELMEEERAQRAQNAQMRRRLWQRLSSRLMS